MQTSKLKVTAKLGGFALCPKLDFSQGYAPLQKQVLKALKKPPEASKSLPRPPELQNWQPGRKEEGLADTVVQYVGGPLRFTPFQF